MALPTSYNLTNGSIDFNLLNDAAYFKLNDGVVNFHLNAVTTPSGDFRLLEDEFMRLLETGDFRLLE